MIPFTDKKDPGEKTVLTFDFSAALPAGVTVTGAASVPTIAVRSGAEQSPSLLLNGSAQADQTGTKVLVPVQGGLDGTDYVIKVFAQTTDPLRVPVIPGVLSVRA